MKNLNKVNQRLITISVILLVIIGLYTLFITIFDKKIIKV